jgi:hypothetical protein
MIWFSFHCWLWFNFLFAVPGSGGPGVKWRAWLRAAAGRWRLSDGCWGVRWAYSLTQGSLQSESKAVVKTSLYDSFMYHTAARADPRSQPIQSQPIPRPPSSPEPPRPQYKKCESRWRCPQEASARSSRPAARTAAASRISSPLYLSRKLLVLNSMLEYFLIAFRPALAASGFTSGKEQSFLHRLSGLLSRTVGVLREFYVSRVQLLDFLEA